MMKLSKQNIIVLVVCIAALSLLFVFHFHNGSDASASHLTMSSQVNLRGLENSQKISQIVAEPLSLHRSPSVVSAPPAAPEIGEFGSPAPLTDITTTVDNNSHQLKNDTSSSIISSSSNIADTTAATDLVAHEHQFAIDNLRNGPTADHDQDHDHGADAVTSTEEAVSVATSDKAAVSAAPTALPTRVPTEPPVMTAAPTLAPTLTAPAQATASPTAPPAAATPAPTAEPPFEAQTFSGQADQEVSWAAVRDAYANDFFAFAQQLDAVADVLPSSSTELVHSALKKGAIQASAAGLNAGGGSSDSTLSDALLDAVASLRPGTVVTYAYASTAATLIPKLAKRLASYPIVSHVFRSPGGSGGGGVTTLPPHFANVVTLHHTSPATGRQAAPLDCVQTLEDFTLLVHEQLPFEFEDAVHRFLCQCNVTYLPKTLPPTPYFAAWDAVETLIDHAAHHVEQPTCQLAFLPSATLTEKYASLVRYSHLLVTRNATAPAAAAAAAAANASFWRLDDLAQLPLSTASAVSLASSLVQRWATQSTTNDTSAAGTDEALFWVGKALLNDAEATTLLAKGKAPTRVVHVDYVANRPPTATAMTARQLRHNATDASDTQRQQRRRLYTTSGGSSSSSRYDEVDHVDGAVPHVLWLAHDTVGSDDAVLMAMMRTLQEQPAATAAKDTTSGGPRMSLTKATRTAQAQLYRDESDNYRFWMQLVRDGHVATAETGRRVLDDLQHVHRVNGTLAVWGRDVGLFSTKLAMLLQRDASLPPSSMLQVTVLSDAAAASTADTLYKLNAVMNVPHNVIATPAAWSASFFVAMAQSRVAWDVSLVESDVWLQLLAAALADVPLPPLGDEEAAEEAAAAAVETAFVQRTALFLATSRVTYWKLPASRRLWTQVLTLLLGAPPTATRQGQRLLALFTQPADVFQRVADVWAGRQRLAVDVVPTATPRHVRVYRFEVIAVSGRSQTTTLLPRGLSLHALSWLQLIPAQRKMVLSLVVQLPLWILRHDEWSQTEGEGQQQHQTAAAAEEVRAMVEAVSVRDIYLRRHVQTGDWEVAVQNIGHFAAEHTIGSRVSRDTSPEITTAHGVWSALRTEFAAHPAEMAQGRFSFLEYHSGLGLISTRLAYAYPDATIFSVEADDTNTERHLQLAAAFNVSNDAVCHLEMDRGSLHRHLYESPELFRFQLFFNNALQQFQETNDLDEWGKHLGAVLSSALTTFVYVPNRALVSLGLYALFGVYCRETDAATTATAAAATGEWQCRSVATHGRGVYIDVDELFAPSSSSFSATAAATSAAEREGRWGVRATVVAEEWHRLTTLAAHPQRFFVNFHSDWLLATARAQSLGSESSVMFSPLALNRGATTTAGGNDGNAAVAYNGALDFPMMRCDIVNMTRHVHHHFDYARDGHSRTYTMRIGVNQTETRRVRDVVAQYTGAASVDDVDIAQLQPQVDRDGVHLTWPASTTTTAAMADATVTLPLGHHACQHHVTSVKLYRDKDNWPIPYVSIYGVTLITALRMGLKTKLRDRLFHEFLRLPLYEDMAPWNIVLFGSTVDYIDYDTKDVTFDLVLPKAYQIMTVLMNYKRTVEDFKRCGSKANTVYGLPYVSDCVAPSNVANAPSCNNDLRYPVPCGDGHCHSDYISCLRSLARIAEQVSERARVAAAAGGGGPASSSGAMVASAAAAVADPRGGAQRQQHQWAQDLASAMKAVVAKFNSTTYEKIAYEDFMARLQEMTTTAAVTPAS